MEAIHELGHVIGARGEVTGVHLPLVGISSTSSVADTPATLAIFAGPLFGGVAPCLALLLPRIHPRCSRALRFFVGFCLVANGVYLSAGTCLDAGDSADLVHHGVPIVLLVLIGAAMALGGLWVWHRNGSWCGLGPPRPSALHPSPVRHCG